MSSIIGLLIASLSAIFKSSSEIVSKFGLVKDLHPLVMGWSLRFFALPFIALAVLFTGIPEIESQFWPALVISGSISIAGTVLYMSAIKYSDISIISPLGSLTPLLLLFTSPIIVNEFPEPFGFTGVMVVVFGVYLMKINTREVGYLEPIRAIWRERGAKYMLGLVVLYSISANFDKVGTEAASPVFYSFSQHIFSALGMSILMIYFVNGWAETVRKNWKTIAPVGILSGMSSIAQMIALTYTLVIYVLTVKRLGILFSVLGGHFIFDEKNIKERVTGALVIIIGVIIISLSLV